MKAKVLVADTAAFIKCVPLWEYAETVYTIPEVIAEIRDKQTAEYVESLPIQLEFRQPKAESIKVINTLTKKTGEFNALSLTDVKVLALTYELDVEAHGGSTDHLCFEPQQIVCDIGPPRKQDDVKLAGFYYPSNKLSEGNAHFLSAVSSDENDTGNETGSESDPEHTLSLQPSNSPDISWEHVIGLEIFLADNSYVSGFLPTAEDLLLCNTLRRYPQFYPSYKHQTEDHSPSNEDDYIHQTLLPHIWRWMSHIDSFSKEERDLFPPSEQSLADILHDFQGKAKNMEDEDQESGNNLPQEIGSLSISEKAEDTQKDNNGTVIKINSVEELKDEDEKQEDAEGDEEEVEEFRYEDLNEEDRACIDAAFAEGQINQDGEIEGEYGDKEYADEENGEADEDDDDDDEGWITPSNVKKYRGKRYGMGVEEEEIEEENVLVACMSTDFSLQNTLKHMHLNVVGIDGRIIKQVRTFILRCFSCFKLTSQTTKIFCPKCGNKTLKKVSVTLNPDGSKKIWINSKKQISKRGMKFSLPTYKGGRNTRFPLLYADQKQNRHCPSSLSKKKVNPLDVDYVSLSSPFAVRDVYSRAAQLGNIAGKKYHQLYWERKNPNAPMKKGKGRKKK